MHSDMGAGRRGSSTRTRGHWLSVDMYVKFLMKENITRNLINLF